MGKILRAAALDHVAGDGERGASEPDQGGIPEALGCQAGADQAHRLHDRRHPFGDPGGVQRRDTGLIAQHGENRPLAFPEFQAVPERPGQHQDVAEQDGGVEAVAADRLQRHLGREVGGGAEGDEILHPGADRPVFRQIAPRLAHQPDRRRPYRLTAQGSQQRFHRNVHWLKMGAFRLCPSYRCAGQATNACSRRSVRMEPKPRNIAIALSEAAASVIGRDQSSGSSCRKIVRRGYHGLSRRPLNHRQQPS